MEYVSKEETLLVKLFFGVLYFLHSSTSLGEYCHTLADTATGSQNGYQIITFLF